MSAPYTPMNAMDALDVYFIENRSRLLDIAAFLDRIDRYPGTEQARADYRYQAFMQIIDVLKSGTPERTKQVQLALSDPTDTPLASARGKRAYGAWKGQQ
ncbi:hypothetical protein [Aquaspirillum sp. LM1]|uniref:hypothetical protein n=1 Tax=Aquaspirillum sp. LM1 TaxID=1938604 RepID=UPI0009866742|nr:hypothetical protein [Aquaspirillum sp. LM1]